MKLKYSIPDSKNYIKSMGKELHISRKHAYEIARTIKGMNLSDAMEFLENVILLKQAVPFKRYTGGVGHRKGMSGVGRYPQKAAKEILKVLENAENNANYRGHDLDRMKIKHIVTKKGRTFMGYFPRAQGRSTRKRHETVSVEVILEEF